MKEIEGKIKFGIIPVKKHKDTVIFFDGAILLSEITEQQARNLVGSVDNDNSLQLKMYYNSRQKLNCVLRSNGIDIDSPDDLLIVKL